MLTYDQETEEEVEAVDDMETSEAEIAEEEEALEGAGDETDASGDDEDQTQFI